MVAFQPSQVMHGARDIQTNGLENVSCWGSPGVLPEPVGVLPEPVGGLPEPKTTLQHQAL